MGRHVPPGAAVVTAQTFDAHLAERARARPDAPAVLFGGETCSYAELDRRVARMAGQLAAAGVGLADRVVLVADNSADHLAAALAVWRAGGVLVTIYPSSTEAELAFAIERAEPVVVVAGSAGGGNGPDRGRWSDSGRARRHGGADRSPRRADGRRARPDRPRCARPHLLHVRLDRPPEGGHAHPSRAARCGRRLRRVWHLGPDDATLVCLPMAWAFGLVTTSMAALLTGGRVVALARASRRRCSGRWPTMASPSSPA